MIGGVLFLDKPNLMQIKGSSIGRGFIVGTINRGKNNKAGKVDTHTHNTNLYNWSLGGKAHYKYRI